MRKKTTIVLLILTLSIYASNINVQSAEENNYRPTSLELTPHDPISITSDSDFEVFPGTGIVEDPHIIEGYIITTTSNNGIYITDTTKYFVIRDCYVDASDYGIYIWNVTDGTATVINNTCNNNGYDGIKIDSSGSSTVVNNTCSNNYWDGISLSFSGSSTVANNTFTNCGLDIFEYTIDAYLSYTIENNWVNGKKLGFYSNLDSTIIAEPVYGQLILVNCTNVTVRDQILDSAGIGLSLGFCTYSTIINNTCSNNIIGIYLHSSDSLTVINNTCSNNNYGIWLENSDSLTVINNTCSNNNWSGIWLWDSGSSTVANNMCNNNNMVGISLHDSGSSTVINNTCNNNNYGIYLDSSSGSKVEKNTCNNNNNYGISLDSSDFCVVTYN
ncbi:MAG: right-handed parallel beta-helix repeat-containing protein, partial [Candidatus Heimdallarchaeota archaeon]|nr:right-handed parallel beta-helix repeat-containing protein [Candidatus Heimdallarchaeota archaeon]